MADAMNILVVLEQDDDNLNSTNIDEDDDVPILAAVACFMRRSLNRVNGFFEQTIPAYLPSEFRSHFRMTRTTFELMLREIMNIGMIPMNNNRGRPVIPPAKQILLFLWTMVNKEPNRAIADRFDVTISSAHRTLRRVTEAVLAMYPRYIKWPNVYEAREIAAAFEDEGGFPNVAGVIDGTHVCIRAPEYKPEVYINRKKFHSLNVQVVCDNNLVLLDVYAGWPGSVHDSRVLRNSGLYNDAANKFPGDSYLLGDGGYPLLRWLITPFRDNGYLTRQQRRFNTALSSLRQKVERSISLLKGRWRKLKDIDHLDLELPVNIIIAACVLHNFCLVHGDFDSDYFLPDDDNDGNNDDNDGNQQYDGIAVQKRQHLMNIVVP